jgi:hypothetical protein
VTGIERADHFVPPTAASPKGGSSGFVWRRLEL